jgi:ketosteroid isomerase-like protein
VPTPAELARSFFGAYARGDREASAALLADDVTAYVTNASGEADVVTGRDDYMARVPDLQSAAGSIEVTQVLEIDDELVMSMVEIRARRKGRELHNFAAFLARIAGGRIVDLWMVDAKPAYSDEFWS